MDGPSSICSAPVCSVPHEKMPVCCTNFAPEPHFGADSQVALAAPVVLAISWVIATSGLHIDYSRAEGLAITFNKEAVSSDDQGKALPDFLKSLPKPSLAAGS